MASNPRRSNGSLRNKQRKEMAARQEPCALCGNPIDYSLPPGDPWSFELDEIVPVSRFREGGYESAEQCAQDPANHQPAHRVCNRMKGNRMAGDAAEAAPVGLLPCVSQTDWLGLYGTGQG